MSEDKERIKKTLERALKTRDGRPLPGQHEYILNKDPGMFDAYQETYERAFLDGKELPAKYRELVGMAVLAAKGGGAGGVISHGLRAWRLGCTVQEMIDAANTTLVPGGAPTWGAMLSAARACEEEENKQKATKK